MLLAARPTQWPANRYKHKTTRRGAQLGCTLCTEQSTAQRDMANFDAGDWLLCKVWFAETVAALNPEELERMILDAQNAAAERGNLTTCLCCDAQCKFNPCSDCSTAAPLPTNSVCFVLQCLADTLLPYDEKCKLQITSPKLVLVGRRRRRGGGAPQLRYGQDGVALSGWDLLGGCQRYAVRVSWSGRCLHTVTFITCVQTDQLDRTCKVQGVLNLLGNRDADGGTQLIPGFNNALMHG